MEKYLIAIDLDGTLLQDWQTVSDSTVKYLKKVKAMGHEIVLATGRPFRSAEEFYDRLELTTPLINYNGGLVTAKHDKNFQGYSLTVNYEAILDIFHNTKNSIENAFGEIKDDIKILEEIAGHEKSGFGCLKEWINRSMAALYKENVYHEEVIKLSPNYENISAIIFSLISLGRKPKTDSELALMNGNKELLKILRKQKKEYKSLI